MIEEIICKCGHGESSHIGVWGCMHTDLKGNEDCACMLEEDELLRAVITAQAATIERLKEALYNATNSLESIYKVDATRRKSYEDAEQYAKNVVSNYRDLLVELETK